MKALDFRHMCLRSLLGLALLWLVCGQAVAQEQFFTQSGGRGLQNAKTNARLSKVEGDVDTLNVEMAKIKPHAKAELGNCPDAGDKLRYNGINWICERETDPTVQPFAKKALPACGAGMMIGAVGGEFGCVPAGFVVNENDPTVQQFAKTPLPGCNSDQLLAVGGNGQLKCMNDQVGTVRENDPNVHDFARKDVIGAVPNCSSNEVLTMYNGRLACRTGAGLLPETDPLVADFARKDISGYTLAACGSGELLRAIDDNGKVLLKCETLGASVGETLYLGELKDVDTTGQVSGSILIFNGTEWRAGSEADPTVPGWAKSALSTCGAGQVLTYDGTSLTCVNDVGGSGSPITFAGLGDVNVTGVSNGQFVKYDSVTSKWIPGTVQPFAQAALPTCTTGQTLTGNGTSLSCVNDAGGSADPVDLVELGDVRTGPSTVLAPSNNDFLRYNSTTSKWVAVHDKLSATQTSGRWCYYNGTDVVCDRGAPQQCATGDVIRWNTAGSAFDCVSGTTALGLGTMAYQDSHNVSITGGVINGTPIGGTAAADGRFTNLRVTGNLYVSGSQTIDGVSFNNGGVVATGTVTATLFSGSGAALTDIEATNLQAAGYVGSIQFKGLSNEISGTAHLNWNEGGRNLGVSGTVQVAGSGAEPCNAAAQGKMRVVDVGGGDIRMQFCRP